MNLEIKIDTDNEALQTCGDVAQALRVLADRIENGKTEGKVMDVAGNSVGTFSLKFAQSRA